MLKWATLLCFVFSFGVPFANAISANATTFNANSANPTPSNAPSINAPPAVPPCVNSSALRSFVVQAQNADGNHSSATLSNNSFYGSGFFVKNGLLTSYHIVSQAKQITVHIHGEKHQAQIIGFDEVLDIALLKTDFFLPTPPPVVSCTEGDFGRIIHHSGSICAEIISQSGLNYSVRAKVKEGQSGSPFVLQESGICGVLTGYNKKTGNAIVAKISDEIVLKLKNSAQLYKKDLQINVANLTIENARLLNLNLKNLPNGVLVVSSQNQQIQEWDIITKINNIEIFTTEDLLKIVNTLYSTQEVQIEIISKGEIINITA